MTKHFSGAEIAAVLVGVLLAVALLSFNELQAVARPLTILLTLAMVVWIAIHDARTYTILDGPLICLAALGVADRLSGWEADLTTQAFGFVLDALLSGGALFLVRETYFRLRGYDGIGFGDVKLAAVGGILVGVVGFAWALLIASCIGLTAALVAFRICPDRRIERLPFGALLAPVCWMLWMAFGPLNAT